MPEFLVTHFNLFLIAMVGMAVIVFISLFFVNAGYGIFRSKKWGFSLPNKVGWFLMEIPVFALMCYFFLTSDRIMLPYLAFFIIFQIHYFQRVFIFPLLIKGKSRMPIAITLMGVVFNSLNALMQAGWLFYISPSDYYGNSWLISPQFIIGTLIFFAGFAINIDSDYIIRHLRKPGDTNHYLPQKHLFKYITSANYFGEFMEWVGFAILTWSWAGAVFAIWTFANLAPRAIQLNRKYKDMFAEDFAKNNPKSILPFIL